MGYKSFGWRRWQSHRLDAQILKDEHFGQFCLDQVERLERQLNSSVARVREAYDDCSVPAFETRR
jgi:hypothetical protein